jgi:hypothetical protein
VEPDGSDPVGLDEFNGHRDGNGKYHYHCSKAYPYVNGGLRGLVNLRDDQITPQPRTIPIRPPGRLLHGARIVGFTCPGPYRYTLEYTLGGERHFVNYSVNDDQTYTFEFVDGTGWRRVEIYHKGGTRSRVAGVGTMDPWS